MRRQALIGALLATAAGFGTAHTLSAQEPDVVRLEEGPVSDRLIRIVLDRRARLGIKVGLQSRATDSIGAYVDAVTPGGPADQAGIRSGDLITRLDGKSVLAGGAAEGEAGSRQSLPGLRLIELAARLEPNDTVPVEYRRGKDRVTVSVVTSPEPEMMAWREGPTQFGVRRPGRRLEGPRQPVGEFMARDEVGGSHWRMFNDSPLGQLELAPLNSDLGRYFGTEEGVLVISAPQDSAMGLKGGDVVLSVDGRKASSPSQLLKILRSYESEETFKLDIMRNRKRETITSRLGDRDM